MLRQDEKLKLDVTPGVQAQAAPRGALIAGALHARQEN